MGWVIAICNPKGGTGKTTTAVTLAEQLARDGARVAVLDLDGQQTVANWSHERGQKGYDTPFAVEGYPPTQPIEGFLPLVKRMSGETDYLILDLEGIASVTMTRAMSRAHLVIVPIGPRHLDGEGAAHAVQTIRDEEDVLGRVIPYRILVNRAANGSVIPSGQTRVIASIDAGEIDRFRCLMREGRAFDDIWAWSALLHEQADENGPLMRSRKDARARATTLAQINRALDDTSKIAAETKDLLTHISHTSRAAITEVSHV